MDAVHHSSTEHDQVISAAAESGPDLINVRRCFRAGIYYAVVRPESTVRQRRHARAAGWLQLAHVAPRDPPPVNDFPDSSPEG